MDIVYLSTFGHLTSLNTAFKTAVPETTRGKKEGGKKFHNRIIEGVKHNVHEMLRKTKHKVNYTGICGKHRRSIFYF